MRRGDEGRNSKATTLRLGREYKPRVQMRGGTVAQKITLLKCSYFLYGGGSKLPKILFTWIVHGPLLCLILFESDLCVIIFLNTH